MKKYKIAESGTIEREVFKMGDANELVRIKSIKTKPDIVKPMLFSIC